LGIDIFLFSIVKRDLSPLNVLVYSIGSDRGILICKGSSEIKSRQIYVADDNAK
jgi:hypothetical protein